VPSVDFRLLVHDFSCDLVVNFWSSGILGILELSKVLQSSREFAGFRKPLYIVIHVSHFLSV
jgi:hypothetical protein